MPGLAAGLLNVSFSCSTINLLSPLTRVLPVRWSVIVEDAETHSSPNRCRHRISPGPHILPYLSHCSWALSNLSSSSPPRSLSQPSFIYFLDPRASSLHRCHIRVLLCREHPLPDTRLSLACPTSLLVDLSSSLIVEHLDVRASSQTHASSLFFSACTFTTPSLPQSVQLSQLLLALV